VNTVDVGVVIVTYRSVRDISGCLDSLAARTTVSHHVVVVDNASDDGTADLVADRFPGVELIRSATNLGFASGANLGAARHDSRYILLLNPDTELCSPAVDELVRVADAKPWHLIYGGRTRDRDGVVDPLSAWGLPTVWSLTCFALGLTTAFRRNRWLDPESLGPWPRDTEREVEAVSGCLQLIERSLWCDLGGLDERYFMYGEDADWAIRARDAGARPLLVPSADIVHNVGASSASDEKRVMVMRGKVTLVRLHWGRKAGLGVGLLAAGTFLRGPLANVVRRIVRKTPDESWRATWNRRAEWMAGW